MNRYSLPRQAHFGLGIFAAVAYTTPFLADMFVSVGNLRTTVTIIVGLVITSFAFSYLIPEAYTEMMTDCRPYAGTFWLTLAYIYIFAVVETVIVTLLGRMKEQTFYAAVTGMTEGWGRASWQDLALGPLIGPVFLWPLTLLYFVSLWMLGGTLFKYLGRRRDYL